LRSFQHRLFLRGKLGIKAFASAGSLKIEPSPLKATRL
jgi:hypothetical protein